MKKVFLTFVLSFCLLFSFTGCGKSDEKIDNTNDENNISLTLKKDTLTTKGATFIIKNDSDVEYTYGPEFTIEKMEDGKWKEITLDKPVSWNSVVYTIKANDDKEINIEWTSLYNELENGKYRLVKKIFKEEDNHDAKMRSLYLYSLFEITSGKELIKLGFREALGKDFEDEKLVNSKKIDLEVSQLSEIKEQRYNNNLELKTLSDYIDKTFNIKIDSNWKVFVHFYDDNKTLGMVEFIYTIGEINTNRSIIFNINNGKIDTVYYKCLFEKINENELSKRLNLFKSRYIQEKKLLKDDEIFESEETNYVYYINSDTLVYNYALYFSYGPQKFINNDYGSVRIIDKYGNASR